MPPQEPRQPPADIPGHPSWIAPIRPVVPDHELLVRIGGGSYGDVWLARSIVGTWRAVKVVFRDRFLDARPYEREFSGIQNFEPLSRSNEGFVDVLQIGRNDADGYFYYVMELADDAAQAKESDPCEVISSQSSIPESPQPPTTGRCSPSTGVNPETYVPKTLSKVMLQRGRLPVGECLELGITLNLALARLHTAGLIHRDVKPSNIIFVGGVPKLADIGLVIEFAEARSYVGTEGFIPPEGPNSPQADLYGLGKVLYEAGMGKDRKDFPEPPTLIAQGPDSAELLEFNAILLKACAANVKDRYQSAVEMNADLALLQSGGSVRRQRTLTRRLRSVQRTGAMVTALAMVIGAGWLWQARQTHLVQQLVQEKTRLADSNRERVIRLDTANGIRVMDEGDLSGALLWFAEALAMVTNNPSAESVHRIRVQQLLNHMPRLLQMRIETNAIRSTVFSPDGQHIAICSDRVLRVWDTQSGEDLWSTDIKRPLNLQFSPDGSRLLAASTRPGLSFPSMNPVAAVFDATSGKLVFPAISPDSETFADFSPDGRWLVTAETNHIIRIIDAVDGHLVSELKGHTDQVLRVSFSADGNMLASASWDRTVRIWHLPSGEPVGEPFKHERGLYQVSLSPDGRWLATATAAPPPAKDGMAQLLVWNISTGMRVAEPMQFEGPFFALSFDQSGRRLLAGGGELFVRILNPETCEELFPALRTDSMVRSWAFSPDARSIALGSDDGKARVWNLETGKPLFPPFLHTGRLESVQFATDGSRLLTGGEEGTTRIWDLNHLQSNESLPLNFPARDEERAPLDRYAFSTTDDRQKLAICFVDGIVRWIALKPLRLLHNLTPAKADGSLRLPCVDPLGRNIAACVDPGSVPADASRQPSLVDLWKINGDEIQSFPLPHPEMVWELRFDSDGSHLLSICRDQNIRVWNTSNGTLQRTILLSGTVPTKGCWLGPDAQTAILFSSQEKAYRLFNLASGEAFGEPIRVQINDLTFDSEGHRFATVSLDQCGRIWSAQTGKLLTGPFRHGGYAGTIRWRSDGRQVITAGLWPEAKTWDSFTGEMLMSPMKIGLKPTRFADWNLSGKFILTASGEHLVRVWDAATAEPITPLLEHEAVLEILADRFITLSAPDRLLAWDLDESHLPADVIADYARLLSGRRLNASGVFLPLNAIELGHLQRSLRSRLPDLLSGR